MTNRRVMILTATVAVVLMVLAGVLPAQGSGPAGAWRLISPTEYTATPTANMHGVFLTNGGTSGKGSGSGWAVSDQGFIFFWDGFSWNQASSPTDCQLDAVNFGGPLNPLSSVTSSSGWIVGGAIGPGAGATCAAANNAVALYYNGVGWTSYPVLSTTFPGTKSEMYGISMTKSASSPTDSVTAFGVGAENAGANGAFWQWNGIPGNGGGWNEVQTVAQPVNAVYMDCLPTCSGTPNNQGAAVGNAGTVFYYFGGAWNPGTSPVGVNLYGVAMSSQTVGWAVGASCTIIHTTDGGATWSGAVSPVTCGTNTLRSVVLVSSSEGWAVGDADASGATVLHGTSLDSAPSWTRIPASQVATVLNLNSVTFATSGGNIWAVGNSGVAAFCLSNCGSSSGAIFSTTTSPNTIELDSVFMVSDSDGWAVGQPDSAGSPTILRWNGGSYSWTRAPYVAPLATPSFLSGVYLSGGSSGWAVGGTSVPGPVSMWYDGNTWTGKLVGGCAGCVLNAVYMVSDSNSWAVGTGGNIMHSPSPGGSFGTNPSTTTTNLFSVYFDPSSGGQSGWAVGGDGVLAPVIVHTSNGGTDGWPTVINPAAAGVVLDSVFFQDGTHGWAAGTKSTILYWNGVSWTLIPILGATGDVAIAGIAVDGGTPATDGWAVGTYTSGGDIGKTVTIHYDGTSWTVATLTPPITAPGTLTSLSLRSSTNGLAVGTGVTGSPTSLSFILHLDPPGGVQGSTVTATAQVTTTSTPTTTAAATTSSTSSQTTQATSSTSSAISQTSAQVTTHVVTPVTTTTTPPQTSSTPITTPVAMPGIPGFPWESIIVGIVVGLTVLGIARRRRVSAKTR